MSRCLSFACQFVQRRCCLLFRKPQHGKHSSDDSDSLSRRWNALELCLFWWVFILLSLFVRVLVSYSLLVDVLNVLTIMFWLLWLADVYFLFLDIEMRHLIFLYVWNHVHMLVCIMTIFWLYFEALIHAWITFTCLFALRLHFNCVPKYYFMLESHLHAYI